MNIKESVAKLFSGSVLNAIIQFAAIVGFTQALGAGAVGSFFIYQAVIGMLGIPVDLGTSRASEKRLSANEPPGEVISTVVLLKAALTVPWIVALFLATPYVEQYVGIPGIVPLVVVGLVASQAERLALRLLAGQLRVAQNALLQVLGQLVWVGGGFVLIDAGWGATAIIASLVLGYATTILGALVRLDLAVGWPRLSRARDLMNFGRYVFIGDVGSYIYQWMDVAVLRLFVPLPLIGAYEIAWRVASISTLLTQAIRASLFPQISAWYSEDRLDKIESAFFTWMQVPLYLTIPAFAGAVVLGEDVLGTLFGPQVTVAYPVLVIFMLESILRSVQLVVGPSLFAMDQPQLGYRGSAAAIVTNLTLNFALIPVFGLIGAAVATTLGAAVAAAVAIWYVSDFVTLRVPWSRVGWSALSATVMAGIVFGIRTLLPPGALRLAVGVGAGAAIYFLLLLAQRGIRVELTDAVQSVRGS
jgi:O-antigen/teichoic acid export membrane protein